MTKLSGQARNRNRPFFRGYLPAMLVVAAAMIATNPLSTRVVVTAFSAPNEDRQDSHHDEAPVCETTKARDPPRILANGSFRDLESLASFDTVTTLSYDSLLDGQHRKDASCHECGSGHCHTHSHKHHPPSVASIPGGEAIDLRYVKDLVAPETAAALIHACDKRNGWTSSPQSVDGSATVKATRTSRSCPLIWPQPYLPLLDDPAYKDRIEASGIKGEIDLAWRLTQRVAQLLGVQEEYIEPFQLVRYLPGEFYKEHHDHGSYYGATTEQRPRTLLVFLSDLPSNNNDQEENSGGYTRFRALGDENAGGVSVVPRMGDGVVWKNEDADGNLLMEAIHEAVPPEDQEGVVKYAMNVWIAKKKIKDNMDVSAYRTS